MKNKKHTYAANKNKKIYGIAQAVNLKNKWLEKKGFNTENRKPIYTNNKGKDTKQKNYTITQGDHK